MRARDRLIIIAGVLFIAACALFTAHRIMAHYSTPVAPGPAWYSVGPLVPESSSTSTAPPSSPPSPPSPTPRRTVTKRVTVTASEGQ